MNFIDKYREEIDTTKKYLIRGIWVLLIILFIKGVIVKVPVGHVGIIYSDLRGGIQLKEFNGGKEGLGFKFPLIETIEYIPKTTQTFRIQGENWIKDKNGITFGWDIAVRYNLDTPQIAEILQIKGAGYTEIISSGIISLSTELFSQYPQQNITQNSTYFSEILQEQLKEKINLEIISPLNPNYIVIQSVNLEKIRYNPEIENNLINQIKRKEQKEFEEGELSKTKIISEKVLIETETIRKKAEAEAETAATLERTRVDTSSYSLRKEAEAKADAITQIGEAYRTVPPAYLIAKAYESIKPTDKLVIGAESIIDPAKIGVVGYEELIKFLNKSDITQERRTLEIEKS